MPDTNHRAPITTHGYRCAGKPAIHDAHAGHGPDESARPLCGMPVVPDESARPSCGVPVVPDESARPLCGMPVVPDESERPSCGVPVGVSRVPCGPSPGRCPSCRASPVQTRVLVEARRAGRVPCRHESRSMPVVPPSPVPERVPVDARHLPCPGPTYACRRRRQPLCCEHIFACTPWRFMNARSAARLRRIVGPQLCRASSITLQ